MTYFAIPTTLLSAQSAAHQRDSALGAVYTQDSSSSMLVIIRHYQAQCFFATEVELFFRTSHYASGYAVCMDEMDYSTTDKQHSLSTSDTQASIVLTECTSHYRRINTSTRVAKKYIAVSDASISRVARASDRPYSAYEKSPSQHSAKGFFQ